VQHHAQSSLASALVRGLVGGVALLGCPQLLQDGFETASGLPSVHLNTGGPDGGTSTAGGSGSGPAGAAGAGGTGTDPSGDAGQDPALSALGALLLHRYPFDSPGTTVVDSVGNADGTTAAVQSDGRLTLSGSDYVDLPNGIISGLESVTIEAWVSWSFRSTWSAEWQLIFSFGTNANGENRQGSGTTYLALTPQDYSGNVRASYTLSGYDQEDYASSTAPFPTEAGTQVVMVVDGAQGSLTLYVDGARAGIATDLALDLAAIDDVNNWIGRSQFTEDKYFTGDVLDFRIYGGVLSETQVALSYAHGADASF